MEEKIDLLMTTMLSMQNEMRDFRREINGKVETVRTELKEEIREVQVRLDKVEVRLNNLERNAVTKERLKLTEKQLLGIGFDLKEEILKLRNTIDRSSLETMETKTESLRLKIAVKDLEERVSALEVRV